MTAGRDDIGLADVTAEPAPPPTPAAASPALPGLDARLSDRMFVVVVAACMAMVGLAIDTLLPAFAEIRRGLGLDPDATSVTLVVTAFFLGLATGQLFYGPLSDRYGRKPLLYAGLGLCITAASAAALAPNLWLLVAARFVWGFGAAGPRSLSLAMVRDVYSGDRMARTMSFAMGIFMLSPVVAPSIGAALISIGSWQLTIWFLVAAAVALTIGMTRIPETLPPARRRPPGPGALRRGAVAVLRTRVTMAYTVAVMFLFGSMAAYLAGSQIIIDRVYHRKDQFPLIFGALSIFMGVATLLNARLVTRYGLAKVIRGGAMALVSMAALFAVITVASDGKPAFWLFCGCMALLLPMHTLLFPNSNAAAMGPVGHVAGTAAAVVGTASTAGGALLGSFVDGRFDGTVRPLAFAFVGFGAVAATAILAVARPR